MPHSANRLIASANAVTGDPEYLSTRSEAISTASSVSDLVTALQLADQQGLAPIAQRVDEALPPSVRDAIVAAYKGAAVQGTDGVAANWRKHAGHSVSISQTAGSDAKEDQGHISITIEAPEFDA